MNRINCPYCGEAGFIETTIVDKIKRRIYRCDCCHDVWTDLKIVKDKETSFDVFLMQNNLDANDEDFTKWEYVIK